MSFIRGALTDENDQWDVAYVSLFGLMLVVVSPIIIMTIMGVVAHFRCKPHELVVGETITVVACNYDPQPLGIAIGSACGGFGVALGALAAYMAATRRPQQQSSTTTTRSTQETTTATVPPVPAVSAAIAPGLGTPSKPLNVDVVDAPKSARAVKGRSKPRGK